MLRALILMLAAGVATADELPFRVIVHPSNPAVAVSRAELSAIYMKRNRGWRGGGEVIPVDQPATSRVRESFSRAIHGKSVAYVTRYWQRLIFSGRALPPRELRNDAAVLAFIRANRDAIGYIDRNTPLIAGVKAIAVTP